jgi:hypothetical protein
VVALLARREARGMQAPAARVHGSVYARALQRRAQRKSMLSLKAKGMQVIQGPQLASMGYFRR